MTKSAASTSKNAAVASARACLDVLRGAAVLLEHNKEAIVELLSGDFEEGAAASCKQELAMLQGLSMQLSKVIELYTPTSEVASGGYAVPSKAPEGVVGVMESPEVTARCIMRPRGQDTQAGQQWPHHYHSAAAATITQSTTPASAKGAVLASVELLVQMMGYVYGGSGDVWVRTRGLGEMALVCRAWRDAAQSEALWGPLVKQMIPRLPDKDLLVTHDELGEGAAGSYRRYLVLYGQLTLVRGLLTGRRWAYDLVLQCDIWDPDGFSMFSSENEVRVVDLDGAIDIAVSGVGPTFSVASRASAFYGVESAQTMRGLMSRCLFL